MQISTGSLLNKAYLSQLSLPSNSGNTHTFVKFCSSLFNSLNINYPVQADYKSKSSQKILGTKLRQRIEGVYRNIFFQKLCDISSVNKGKLILYSKLKKVYNYEPYLNHAGAEHLTRIRISNHWLPIERGRYTLPKTPKENNRSAASPTRPQSVGGNCSPESALKPRS